MGLSLTEIKKKIISNQQTNNDSSRSKEKESLLRPWQDFKRDRDLIELITNRKNKKNIVRRKEHRLIKGGKQEKDMFTEEGLRLIIKKRAEILFKKLR